MEKKVENNHSYLVYWGYFVRVEKSLAVKVFHTGLIALYEATCEALYGLWSHCGLLIE